MPKLILMRGVSGSGKSTLAKQIAHEVYPDVVVLSTDDHFYVNNKYLYKPECLAEYHGRTQLEAAQAMAAGVGHVIIDNTNTQSWEMKPYVELAIQHGYNVEFRSPPAITFEELMARQELRREENKCLPAEVLKRQLDRFEQNVTVRSILQSRR